MKTVFYKIVQILIIFSCVTKVNSDVKYSYSNTSPLIPRAINDSGVILGKVGSGLYYRDENGDHSIAQFIPPGKDWILKSAYDINNRGQVLIKTFSDIGLIFDINTKNMYEIASRVYSLNSINDSENVVGSIYSKGSWPIHAFLYNGSVHDLGTGFPEDDDRNWSQAWVISNNGLIVGIASGYPEQRGDPLGGIFQHVGAGPLSQDEILTDAHHGFVNAINSSGVWVGSGYLNGTSPLPPLPGHDSTEQYGINDMNQIVGESWQKDGPKHVTSRAVLWDSNGVHDLTQMLEPSSMEGFRLTTALGINNRGEIICIGNGLGYLLKPIGDTIEPPTLFAPDDNALISAAPTFQMQAPVLDDEPMNFEVEVSKDGITLPPFYAEYPVGSQQIKEIRVPEEHGLQLGFYTWRARMVDILLEPQGEWSATRNFQVFGGIDLSSTTMVQVSPNLRKVRCRWER